MRKVFKTCPGRISEKLRKQFRDTQSVPFILDKSRKPLFLRTKNDIQKQSDFFSRKMSHSAKNSKRGDLRDLLTYILLQNIKKLEGDPSETLKNFHKSQSAKKIKKGDP